MVVLREFKLIQKRTSSKTLTFSSSASIEHSGRLLLQWKLSFNFFRSSS